MRKLRKKIYKHSVQSKHTVKKSKDCTEQIMSIFKTRGVPSFVTETLKKRRSFDMTSIKNIAIYDFLPFEEILARTNKQEEEVNQLYADHKQRMQEIKEKAAIFKSERSISIKLHPMGIYSTTEEEEMNSPSEQQEDRFNMNPYRSEAHFYEDFSENSREAFCAEKYLNMNNMESSLNSELALFNF